MITVESVGWARQNVCSLRAVEPRNGATGCVRPALIGLGAPTLLPYRCCTILYVHGKGGRALCPVSYLKSDDVATNTSPHLGSSSLWWMGE